MRNNVLKSISALVDTDDCVVTLLGDLGTFQMKDSFEKFPRRVINFGIMEQAMIGFAAGLSKSGLYPVVYSITPFLVDRALEQIKVDLVYNNNSALILSAGGSYDYSTLGPTHHCAHDISNLINIGFPLLLHPFDEEEARMLCEYVVSNRISAYLRISTSLFNFDKSLFELRNRIFISEVHNLPCVHEYINLADIRNECQLAVIFGPDSLLLGKAYEIVQNSGRILAVSGICDTSLRYLAEAIKLVYSCTLIVPYDCSAVIARLFSFINAHSRPPIRIVTITPGVYYDNAYSKSDLLMKATTIFNI